MNWLDIILLVLLVVPTLIGLKIGIIKAVLTVIGIIVGVVLAGRFYEPLANVLSFISNEGVAKIVAFAIILIVVMILAAIGATLIKKVISAVLLGWVNRLGGAILGLLLGIIFCGALLSIWVKFLGIGDTIADAALANMLLDVFPMILAFLPNEFDSVRSFFQ
jgi:membrane protein required for colicin V production